MKGENRKPPYTDRNPGGQLPALELDNGKCIGETVAIWEYLEEKHPNPPLIGTQCRRARRGAHVAAPHRAATSPRISTTAFASPKASSFSMAACA